MNSSQIRFNLQLYLESNLESSLYWQLNSQGSLPLYKELYSPLSTQTQTYAGLNKWNYKYR